MATVATKRKIVYARQKSKNFFEKYQELPIVAQIGIPVGLFLLGRSVISSVKAGQIQQQYTTATNTEATQWQQQGQGLSYPLSQYMTWADQLETDMQYMGTYPDDIYSIMEKMKTNGDVLQLIKAFGKRDIYFFGGANNFTLPQALTDELSEGWITEINELFSSKGIVYRF